VDGDMAAHDVDVGGSVKAKSVTATTKVEVGGSIITVVGVSASSVEIGRRGEVVGPVRADEVFVGERARVEDIYAKTITLDRKAHARNLYGGTIRIESDCGLSGEVQYTESLRSERNVSFARAPVKVEKLPH